MSIERLQSSVSDLFFYGAFVLLDVAILERILLSGFGVSLMAQAYGPWRLTQFAAVLMIFVAVVSLREIRDELKSRNV